VATEKPTTVPRQQPYHGPVVHFDAAESNGLRGYNLVADRAARSRLRYQFSARAKNVALGVSDYWSRCDCLCMLPVISGKILVWWVDKLMVNAPS
jgi:hypothetical protein